MAVVALAFGLWVLGWLFAVPARRRWGAIAALWLAVMAVHLILPAGHGLRSLVGGDARVWAVVGGVAVLVLAYRTGLAALRVRAQGAQASQPAAEPAPPAGAFAPQEIDRYARHILLREIGGPGQQRLKAARVLVVGAGGLGSPALMYLAAAGVGEITVIDDDKVDLSNLQRQIIHGQNRLGMDKAISAVLTMQALNPHLRAHAVVGRLEGERGGELVAAHDLVLDGTDNFDTRYLVNRLCVAAGKPLISAAITQWEGQLSLYDPARGGPCYECIFPHRPAPGMVPTCAEAGVAAPLPGVIGAMMAMEAVKHLTGAGETLRGRLMIHDALYGETRVIGTRQRPDCAVCGATGP